ncbi:NAD-glutamate dehydrogenase [Pseudazoarcus pumilus]|uniref:NAD-glutamate dehydrogenase n=1 Tax=Pseudazoarcus pumilus TaxID=2067960 RepID=A0A2I6S3J5_9RHOO|nr:NAD-glutamate dehydrogenase [Pseudazoarcus pumilus]AUN93834.1 NAD-glutamate dehydrogenase [Pseudazoarcus pumilus]
MTRSNPVDRVVDAVAADIPQRLPAAEASRVAPFVRHWFDGVDPADLAAVAVPDLCTALLSHWDLMQRRTPGRTLVRVLDPSTDAQGWGSPHTVVQIVTDDMPFLVDSVTMELNRRGLTLHLLVHPVLCVERDQDGVLRGIGAGHGCEVPARLESAMHIEVDRLSDAAARDALRDDLLRVFDDVRAVVEDWPGMRQRLIDIATAIDPSRLPVPVEETVEAGALIDWLLADNFVILGCRDYLLAGDGERLDIVAGSGLGLLRERPGETVSSAFAALSPEVREQARAPELLTLTKAGSRSSVHRPGRLDYVGVRTFDSDGRVAGERRVLGLFASTAYSASPWKIPMLRRKVERVITRAGLLAGSHADKALRVILERYPRDELFQIDTDTLFEHAMSILRLGERQRTRLLTRRDPFGRFVSCLVFVPREHYDTAQRRRIEAVLLDAFEGESAEFDVQLSESPLARILFTVRSGSTIPEVDAAAVEARIVEAARPWSDALRQALVVARGEARGLALFERWGNAFPAGYRESVAASDALDDIARLDALAAPDDLGMWLFRSSQATGGGMRFKLYRLDAPMPLSQCLRQLERMGVLVIDEQPTALRRADGRRAWIHDFGLQCECGDGPDIDAVGALFQEVFERTWRAQADNDGFNRLVLVAGLNWREIAVLRACARYLRQAAFPFSQDYMEQALAAHPDIVRLLVDLFVCRFDPARDEGREAECARLAEAIAQALEQVANLDEDRILRQFLALIEATLRTNWFRIGEDGAPRPVLALKLDPLAVPGLPEPRPMFEIFVSSPRVEGVHLRGGKVARGGIRWSDRMEDFRTEVLGLVKAQIVKNAVIVPVGSKGGFVVRRPPVEGGREAAQAEGLACYRLFLSGLLDVTDNLERGRVVPPPGVVRHDGDDPYLVVAADKGTATFSDHANAVSAEYGFWLDDAFASGGSAGYDHKKMGITARGAWESVKRHFRAVGRDIQNEDFTVVGIGDMSGDVFGNGMLLSKHIRLVAAFDHRHVFLDPDPDAAKSWDERARLFALPRSTWDDYDKSLISAGGGVWPRSAKSVPLSPEVRAVLDVEAERLTPAELIRAILRAPVDLVYNGGIGTYVKSAAESDAEVGDRANDAVRVNGGELRSQVVGEGGNLGFTQRGRIEYALAGGRIFTDAIDNSGGVDCSDHEVNIKILLGEIVADGELERAARDHLLADMTDEVAGMVLADNYAQGEVLEMSAAGGVTLLDEQADFMLRLARAGRLNRKLEALPLDEDLAERRAAGNGLVMPELAVLLAYSKIELYDEVLASDVPDDAFVARALPAYFPAPIRERWGERIATHALRREIVATVVVNEVVNRCGATFVDRIRAETGAPAPDIVRAFVATSEVFALDACWRDIAALDNRAPAALQVAMRVEALRLVRGATLWWLRHPQWLADLGATARHFAADVAMLAETLGERIAPEHRAALAERAAAMTAEGVPEALALHVAGLRARLASLDIVDLASEHGLEAGHVAEVYFALAAELDLRWVTLQIDALSADSRWPSLARSALRADLSAEARRLVGEALACDETRDAAARVAAFVQACGDRLERYRALVTEMRGGSADMAMLSVLMRALRGLG